MAITLLRKISVQEPIQFLKVLSIVWLNYYNKVLIESINFIYLWINPLGINQ